MKKSVFDKIELSVFDTTELNVFDETDVDVEDKIIYSKEIADLIQEEIRKEISKIPIGKIIAKVLSKENDFKNKEISTIKNNFSEKLKSAENKIELKIEELDKKFSEYIEKLKKKFSTFRNEIINHPRYEFGGFSPQVNDLNIGDPAADGSWRIIVSGNDLSVQRRESGSWVEKGSFQP